MHYLEIIAEQPIVWGLFAVYLVGTMYLAWLGHKKTEGLSSFAIGKGDMGPIVVGVTLAASIASTATFVINPGFVYVHGLSALMHFGVAAGAGIVTGLLILSLGFRKLGKTNEALTLPQWIGERYESKAMTTFFAGANLLYVFFMVLIVGALSIVMQETLGLTNTESLILIIGFVFSYIFIGGTYAHAYTNTLQGIIMAVIAAIVVASGFHLLSGGWEAVSSTLAAQDPNLVEATNPESSLYGGVFSVYVSGFIIGFALIAQPHVLIKTLYVESDRDMWKSIGIAVVVTAVFTALLLVGFYAHLMEIPREAFVDPEMGFRQDKVVTVYVMEAFPSVMVAIISVTLLAAGMSTLDGILIALSSIVANDLFLNLTENNLLAEESDERKSEISHKVGQGIIVALGILTFAIAYSPPELLGIFGQVGVYGMVAAAAVPLVGGMFFPGVTKWSMFPAALVGIGVHLGLYVLGMWAASTGVSLAVWAEQIAPAAWMLDTGMEQLGFGNPAVTATLGIFASALVGAPACVLSVLGEENGSSQSDERVRRPAPGE